MNQSSIKTQQSLSPHSTPESSSDHSKGQSKLFSKIKGVHTALITPFFKGKIDFDSLKNLVEFQLKSGIQGFIISGTTAESPNLSSEEKKSIFHFVKKIVPDSFPLIVGTGSNSTEKTIKDSQEAESWGADAILVVVPYYNKPPQRGLLMHFNNVANSVHIPTLLYNVPGRTSISLELETIIQLSQNPNILGIKEASGNIPFAEQIRKRCGKDFILLSGDDGTYDEFMKIGGDGVISVVSHIIPEVMLQIQASKHQEIIHLLFVEANPIPVKKALSLMGIIRSDELRLPLVPLKESFTELLKKQMIVEGLLND